MIFHSFHMVNQSPWPILSSFNSLMFMTSLILFFKYNNLIFFFISFFFILLNMFQWWRDIIRESTYQGYHTNIVKKGLKLGMLLFIVSEIFFFLSFFWAFFHSSLSPDIEIGIMWPPMGVNIFNPFHIPLLNTIILLSSGFTVTWTHHCIINKNKNNAFISLLITILLGIYFSFLQMMEYNQANFSIADSIFGSTFFLTTGFHGLHVLIGTIFLLINLIRLTNYQLNSKHHFGFEAAAWYWHFVDVVWIFLFTFMYWWIF